MPKVVDHKLRQSELGRIAAIAIAEHGYDKLTLAELAKRAGCSVGAVSYYAKTKDDVLVMAYEFMHEDIADRVTRVKENHSNLDAVRHALYECLPCASSYSRMYDNLAISAWAKMKDHPEIRNVVQGASQGIRDHIAELIAQAQDAGEISNHLIPEDVAQQIQSHLRALAVEIRMTGYRPSAREQFDYADQGLDGILLVPPTN